MGNFVYHRDLMVSSSLKNRGFIRNCQWQLKNPSGFLNRIRIQNLTQRQDASYLALAPVFRQADVIDLLQWYPAFLLVNRLTFILMVKMFLLCRTLFNKLLSEVRETF